MESTFDLNEFTPDKNYSLEDMLEFDKKNLDQYCFELISPKESEEQEDMKNMNEERKIDSN